MIKVAFEAVRLQVLLRRATKISKVDRRVGGYSPLLSIEPRKALSVDRTDGRGLEPLILS